ncbi:MAG: hypothetical protein GC145_04515 [Caulobacter sp.]|nr:hypothetical protein [Caulobacter sp.]
MARSVPLSRILAWLAVIGAAALVLWLILRGLRKKTLDREAPAGLIAAAPTGPTAAQTARAVPPPLPALDPARIAGGEVDRAMYMDIRERLNARALGAKEQAETILRGLRARVRSGEPLVVFVPFEPGPRTLVSEDAYDDWERQWFPDANSR